FAHHRSRDPLELLEANGEPFAIGAILDPVRQTDRGSGNPFEAEFKERTVVYVEQAVGDMNPEIRVDADQIGIERGMVNLRQRQAVRDDWLTKLLVGINNDVCRIEEPRLRQTGDRTTPVVSCKDGLSERRL